MAVALLYPAFDARLTSQIASHKSALAGGSTKGHEGSQIKSQNERLERILAHKVKLVVRFTSCRTYKRHVAPMTRGTLLQRLLSPALRGFHRTARKFHTEPLAEYAENPREVIHARVPIS